jgi:hypothetical protein
MFIPSMIKAIDPTRTAMLIQAAEFEIAQAAAWSGQATRASDRVKMRANITRQKKQLWQAKHGF